jgi:hypothetical protein
VSPTTASLVVVLLTICLTIVSAWSAVTNKLLRFVLIALGGFAVLANFYQLKVQQDEARNDRKALIREVTELVSKNRIAPDDAQRILRVFVKDVEERVRIREEITPKLIPGGKLPPVDHGTFK